MAKKDKGAAQAARHGTEGQGKKGKAPKARHPIEDDARFAHIRTDPTFKAGRKKHKVRIDERFKGALDDAKFGLAAAPIDKRGKKVSKKSQRETLAPFYELEDDGGGGGDEEKERHAHLEALARGEVDGSMG